MYQYGSSRFCFVYRQKTGERVYDFVISNNAIYTNEPFQEYLIDYYYDYDNEYTSSVVIPQKVTYNGKVYNITPFDQWSKGVFFCKIVISA